MSKGSFAVNLLECRFGKYIFKRRYILLLLCSTARLCTFATKHTISICLPFISSHRRNFTVSEGHIVCEAARNITHSDETIKVAGIAWTQTQDYLLSCGYYVAYSSSIISAGALSDRYGGKYILAMGVLMSGVISVLTPHLMEFSSYWILLTSRIFLGCSQASDAPSILSLIPKWFSAEELTLYTGFSYTGGQLGNIIISGLGVLFIRKMWRATFYLIGVLCFIWYFFSLAYLHSSPNVDPHITSQERIEYTQKIHLIFPKKIPLMKIITDNSVWALICGQIGHDWFLYLNASNLTRYFKYTIGIDVAETTMMSYGMFYLSMWISTLLNSYLSYVMERRNCAPVVYIRGLYTAFGNIGPCFFALVSTYIPDCNPVGVIICYMLAMFFKGMSYIGLKLNIFDMTIHYSGIVNGICNCAGGLTGALIPFLVLIVCKNDTLTEWRNLYILSFSFCSFMTVLYLIFNRSERARWDLLDDLGLPFIRPK